MEKRKRLFIIGIMFIFNSCITSVYKSADLLVPEKEIYKEEGCKDLNCMSIHRDIFKSGKQRGQIFFDVSNRTKMPLIFLSSDGKRITLWKYYDYSGVTKITQTADEKKIRIYSDYVLLVNRNYLTELDLDTLVVRKYRLPKNNSFN